MTHALNISHIPPNLTGRSYTTANYDRASVWKAWCPILRHINGTSIKQNWEWIYKRTVEVRQYNHCCVEQQYCISWGCACVLASSGKQCARSVLYCHCDLFGPDKELLKIKCVVWLSLQLLSETILILSRIQRDVIINVKCPLYLSDFDKTRNKSTHFRKIFKCKISWKSARWGPSSSTWTDRQADRQTRRSS